ncbi:hypothetical protein N7509_014054 [Penicillium cosmopolitanum]|uniref:Uncharacterized protein n=1 Tax=Penicillium cosmopolitanum TaxID=1131564 RepID=A0A9W9RZU5_9EURO|nr:uncharacterized protein N7509_014054 [Penicillium cosmopolitanum]KAJ5369442.1 hypothetical protein N7509_014054 [Penicillium cosmopolitanum]
MDRHPIPFAHTRTASATFPLTHKPPTPRPNDVSSPFADSDRAIPRHVQHKYTTSLGGAGGGGASASKSKPTSGIRPQQRPRPTLQEPSSTSTSTPNHGSPEPRHRHSRTLDPFGLGHHHSHSHSHSYSLDGTRTKSTSHKHKHSKSRELRLPRPMSHLASSASARGLLPTWSGKDKDPGAGRDADDGLLRPLTRETTSRSRWGSESTRERVGGGHERLGPIRRQEIQSMEDLERVKRRRKQGEGYLRSALASTGTQATDATRRLDYTYYNLLERITALNSTIASFQDLSDSASTFLNDFDRETSTLDTEIRKQIIDLKGFTAQSDKSKALESRMKSGREKVDELGTRLAAVKSEIESWERRELDWQERISRRLRIFWAVVGSAAMVLVIGVVLQNWPRIELEIERNLPIDSQGLGLDLPRHWRRRRNQNASRTNLSLSLCRVETGSAWYPASLADRRESLSLQAKATDGGGGGGATSGSSSSSAVKAKATGADDPLRVLDEL